MSPPLPMFASCLPGLEPLLQRELEQLGAATPVATAGGVDFEGDLGLLYRANLCSGLATHVLVRVATFPSRHLSQLRQKADALPWKELFGRGQRVSVRATCKRSKLYHSGAVSERIAHAIAQSTGAEVVAPPKVGDGNTIPVVAVRVLEDIVSLSLDTSGEPLHRRGWRLQTGKAPLREDIAHALLLASGWEPGTTSVDPMCGSGTIPIEAAGLARRLAPGRQRTFAFEQTLLHDRPKLAAVRTEIEALALPSCAAPVFASDRNAGAIAAAQQNAERAGVSADVQFDEQPLGRAPILTGATELGEHGALVCNPPHGRRVGDTGKLRTLYQALGQRARELPDGWRVGICVADRRLALKTGLPLRTGFMTSHGGTKVRAMVCRVGD